MAQPFFGRRDPEPPSTLRPGSGLASGANTPTSPALQPAPASSGAPLPNTVREGGSQLTVGPNIKLKGLEITDCDTLVVEGSVEATMKSRVIQIAEQGAFQGAAEVDVAEIYGRFGGELTVRQKLVVHATGRVSGKICYGKLVVEEGGQLSGNLEVISPSTGAVGAARPVGPALPAPGLRSGLHAAL